ncbi:MAG: tRNA (adenosine(37)-N6)-threonylcarbamoyltransferase complex dimerization subunit type 1 TsaB [Bacilli bacterium]|nr:tRNA (adenosine(37)-N6)-threonylcarbamoyltransferase complex dimerization subunit type 1 TsaB [Bacilli bacterium]
MYTLFIDTHDKNVILIVFKDGKIVGMKNVLSSNKHSEITMPLLDELLKEVKLEVNDINEVIVVPGPGSFTGERIAVTIAKTIAYCLQIPIRVIDSLSILAINADGDKKCVALEDRNGAFVGEFDKDNNLINDIVYMNKTAYMDYKEGNDVITDLDIDYEKVYAFVEKKDSLNPHEVKPLYIKGISALNDKRIDN